MVAHHASLDSKGDRLAFHEYRVGTLDESQPEQREGVESLFVIKDWDI